MKTRAEYVCCTRCVMDTSDPEIVFDALGQCNHCTEYLARVASLVYQGEASERELQVIVDRIKQDGAGREYDCVVGISGGVDSCYTVYLAKKLGLRPLAVHMDNGWNSEIAVRNIRNVCSQLDVDYQSYILDWNMFKDVQLSFLKASIIEMELPTDVAIAGALHQVASANKVKHILSGGNLATEGIMPRSWFYYPKDSKLLKGICRKFGTQSVRSFPTFDFMQEIYYKFVKGIRFCYPLNFVPFSKDQATELLKTELGWSNYGGKHHESRFTKIVQSYIHPIKFGIDYRRATLSTLICVGTISREQALFELEQPAYNESQIAEEKAYVARKLSISLEEFEAILSQPVKTYRDYPNNERLLRFLYQTYRKIFRATRSHLSAGYEN